MNINKSSRVIAISISIIMMLGIAGCSSNTKSTNTTNTKKIGGIVRTAISSEPDNFDPMLSAASDTQAIMGNVFEGLMGYDETGAVIPVIAEKYSASEDGLKYTFTLKKGIKFHNSSDCTSKDVKYTYEKLAGLSGGKALNSLLVSNLVKVDTPDDYTVVLNLKAKDVAFITKCIVAIVPKDYTDSSKKPVGTGPFMFSEYVAGQKVVLVKNPNYTSLSSRKPSIDKVEFRIMTDPNAILMALKSGDLDTAGIDSKDVATLKSTFDIAQAPQNMVQLFALNNSVKPLNDLKVRQAINYAVDKDAIIKVVANGYGTKLASNMSPIMKNYFQDGLEKYKTNIQKAKDLLKEAGYENGLSFSVTVPSNYKFHVDTAQMLADQLAKVGIKLEIKQVEWAQWLDKVYGKADYESTVIGLTGKLDPQDVLIRYQSKYKNNFYKFSDSSYDELIAKAAVETDTTKRTEDYKACQKILVDQAVAVYIMDPNLIIASKKNLKGFKFYPLRFLDMSSVYYTN